MDSQEIIQRSLALLTGYFYRHSRETQKWIFIVHHSLRVEGLVRQILAGEDLLPHKTNLTLRVAAILHDIGSFRDGAMRRPNHAEVGATVVERLLESEGAFLNDHVSPSELKHLIRFHSRGIDVPVWPELAILRDADILDQVGAMSILEQANQGEYGQASFYADVYTRLTSETLRECAGIAPQLFTSTAKAILENKQVFIAAFIHQLDEELGEARTFQIQEPTHKIVEIQSAG